MHMTPRQLNASLFMLIGFILMAVVEPLAHQFQGAPHLMQAGIYCLSPVGLIFLVLGIYRFTTKAKSKN